MKGGCWRTAVLIATLAVSTGWSAESVSPYIDAIKQTMPSAPDSGGQGTTQNSDSGSYLEMQRKKLGPEQIELLPGDTYIDARKKADPSLQEPEDSKGYTDSVKNQLDPKPQNGAIDAVNRNQSELRAVKLGKIHHAFGFKFGASANRTMTGSSESVSTSFNNFYGKNFVPDFELFYEIQPFHSEIFGNFGLVTQLGLTMQKGVGQFQVLIPQPTKWGGGYFPANSLTNLRFTTVPVQVALDYRFNLFKYVRPYGQIGPGAIIFIENRSDSIPGHHGYSKTMTASAGINFLMDDLFPKESWDAYTAYTTKHYYITLDYTKVTTVASVVHFDLETWGLGVTHEF